MLQSIQQPSLRTLGTTRGITETGEEASGEGGSWAFAGQGTGTAHLILPRCSGEAGSPCSR